MRTPREPIRFLCQDEMETIHRNALRILAEVGMWIDHPESLDYLEAAGCNVDHDTRRVLFPGAVVQSFVDHMRQSYAARTEPESMSVRYSHIRFRKEPFQVHSDFSVNTGGYCVYIYDTNGKRRMATLDDTRQALKIAHQLDQVTYTGLPVAAQDVPLAIRPIRMAAELVKHTDKLGGIEALTTFDIEYITRIGEVVRGGKEELKKRPILVGYAEARTPLSIDANMCEVMLAYLKRGLPQSLDTMPNAGATAPMNPAGALALGIAETLGGLVLALSVDRDAVVSLDVTPSYCDMRTGIFKYASAERGSLLGARIQMISEYYGCPSGVHGGKTDSCQPGLRCGVEKGLSMLMPILCGAVGFGTIGHLENALTFSPVQLVMDNEIARYVRRMVKGFDVTDEAINVDLIKRIGIGGQYLDAMETATEFREWVNLSPYFGAGAWSASPTPEVEDVWRTRALETVQELTNTEYEPVLTDDQIEAVDEIVAEAEAALRADGQL
jgi:trimethylamine---corrinoid protein Co-methyltransferase